MSDDKTLKSLYENRGLDETLMVKDISTGRSYVVIGPCPMPGTTNGFELLCETGETCFARETLTKYQRLTNEEVHALLKERGL